MIAIFNAIISSLGTILQAMLLLLPTSPFNFVLSIDNQWIKAMCWIFPFAQVVAHLQIYCTAVITYYAIRVVLRWIKVVGS